MPERAGNLPAWAAVVAAVIVPLFAAAAAWGAASSRLSEFENKQIELRHELRQTREALVELKGYLKGAGIVPVSK